MSIRGGPLLHMGAADEKPVEEWGRTSLLPLAVSKSGTDTFCASSCDDKTVEKVSRPPSKSRPGKRYLRQTHTSKYINRQGYFAPGNQIAYRSFLRRHDTWDSLHG